MISKRQKRVKGEHIEGQETETEARDRVSLSQSHKSLRSALIVATRQRAVKHRARCGGKSTGRGNITPA